MGRIETYEKWAAARQASFSRACGDLGARRGPRGWFLVQVRSHAVWVVLDSRLHFLKPPVQTSFSCLLVWTCLNEFDFFIFYRTCRQGRSEALVWYRSCACAASQ